MVRAVHEEGFRLLLGGDQPRPQLIQRGLGVGDGVEKQQIFLRDVLHMRRTSFL